MLRQYNQNGELVKSRQTKSWKLPGDIVVKQSGELSNTDSSENSEDKTDKDNDQTS